jgi:dolichol kinase
LSGTFALGIGDALASTIGKAFGTIKWPNRQKSVQGTAAFVIGLQVAFWLLDNYAGHTLPIHQLFIPCLLAGNPQ